MQRGSAREHRADRRWGQEHRCEVGDSARRQAASELSASRLGPARGPSPSRLQRLARPGDPNRPARIARRTARRERSPQLGYVKGVYRIWF